MVVENLLGANKINVKTCIPLSKLQNLWLYVRVSIVISKKKVSMSNLIKCGLSNPKLYASKSI
jgi:hypothetical protein